MTNMLLADDLFRLLHNGLLFTHNGKGRQALPMIEVVRLEFGAEHVLSVATESYVLGVTKADYSQDLERIPAEPMDIELDREDVAKLLKLAKTVARDRGMRHVDVSLIGKRVLFAFTTGESITLDQASVSLPKFRQLIPTEYGLPAEQYIGTNPEKLVIFTKVITGEGWQPLVLTTQGAGKPIMVQIGANFTGLLMPVKVPSGFVRPEWLDPKKPVAESEAAA